MTSSITRIITSFFALIASLVMIITNSVNPAITPFEPYEVPDDKPEVECMDIVSSGVSDYVIVCGKPEGDSEYTAAKKLQYYINEISGVTLPIVSDETEPSEHELVVGKTNREGSVFALDRSGFGEEDVRVFISGERIVIAGGEKRGTLYGVYKFLEQAFDCHWYTSDLIVLPHSTTLGVPVDLSIDEKPYLEYRETDWISPKNVEYSLANGLNSNIYRYLSEENGGSMGYAGGFCHTLTTSVCSSSKYFEAHPEYYALHDGKRTPNQLCLTNPDVLAIVIDEVKAIAAANPDKQIISLTQHDNQDYCECESCKALDDAEGSHSGTMITFVNAVADAIKDEYPSVAIDTFAYQYTRKAPKTVVPRDNVIVRLCSIECCFAHPLNDSTCKQNADFCSDLENWAKICKRLYVWDYTTNYANYIGPFPNFGVMRENMQFFCEHSVVGVYEEGNYTASESDAEFAELRAYLLSRLLWDPYCDYYKEAQGFMKAYYGEGWQYVEEYIRMTTENTGTDGTHMGIYRNMAGKEVLNLTENEISYMNDLWTNAKAKAGTDWQRENVERSELSWRYWKSCNKVSEFSARKTYAQRNSELYADYQNFGIVRVREGDGGLLSASPDFNTTPNKWR